MAEPCLGRPAMRLPPCCALRRVTALTSMKHARVPRPGLQHSLVRVRPHDQYHYTSLGRTVLITRRDGFFDGEPRCGLFVDKTRVLSRWRWLIARHQPQEIATSNVEQHSWLGYYIVGARGEPQRSRRGDPARQTVEMRISRSVGDGMHEDVDLTNYSTIRVDFVLTLEIGADFADE